MSLLYVPPLRYAVSGRPASRNRERRCIYCGEVKQWPGDFNREHVVSEAAGSFENNLPRLRCVCSGCNTHFGQMLEPAFFWGTIEAYLRLYTGIRPAAGASSLASHRLALTIGAPGPWHGVRLMLVAEDDQLVTSLVAQVGFETLRPPGWVFVTRDELDSDAPLPEAARPAVRMKLIIPSEAVEREMIDLLARRGIPFQRQEQMPPPPTEGQTQIRTPIDDIVRRYVCKIAFNYLAHVAGYDFVLRRCFDPMRAFIRFGTLPRWRFFSMTADSPLSDERRNERHTRGHVLGVHWPRNANDILAQVRLFNGPTYRLVLAEGVQELWRPMTYCHLFDPHTRHLHRLTSVVPQK